MMKNLCLLLCMLAIPSLLKSQELASLVQQKKLANNPLTGYYQPANSSASFSRFGVSLNALGFVQFGPVLNVEIGLNRAIRLNAHVRFPSVGLLSYVINGHSDGLDKLEGIAFGGGMNYFFGEKMNQPYLGCLIEYHTTECLYAEGESWEWKQTVKDAVIVFNGGYRFRFADMLFLNTGVFFGFAYGKDNWHYTDYSQYGSGGNFTPFGMAEVTFGFEF